MTWVRANTKKGTRVEIPDGIRYVASNRPTSDPPPKQPLSRESIRAQLMGA